MPDQDLAGSTLGEGDVAVWGTRHLVECIAVTAVFLLILDVLHTLVNQRGHSIKPDLVIYICLGDLHLHGGNTGALVRESFGIRENQVSRSEEHTSELQSPCNLVCRLLLEKKKKQ